MIPRPAVSGLEGDVDGLQLESGTRGPFRVCWQRVRSGCDRPRRQAPSARAPSLRTRYGGLL